MKRIISLLLIVLLFAACLPTPEVDAVKQKDTNVLIETIKTGEQTVDEKPAEVPARFQCDFTATLQNVHVISDVPIERMTDTGVFPTVRVERKTLSDAERQTVVQRVLGSEQLPHRRQFQPQYHLHTSGQRHRLRRP